MFEVYLEIVDPPELRAAALALAARYLAAAADGPKENDDVRRSRPS